VNATIGSAQMCVMLFDGCNFVMEDQSSDLPVIEASFEDGRDHDVAKSVRANTRAASQALPGQYDKFDDHIPLQLQLNLWG